MSLDDAHGMCGLILLTPEFVAVVCRFVFLFIKFRRYFNIIHRSFLMGCILQLRSFYPGMTLVDSIVASPVRPRMGALYGLSLKLISSIHRIILRRECVLPPYSMYASVGFYSHPPAQRAADIPFELFPEDILMEETKFEFSIDAERRRNV